MAETASLVKQCRTIRTSLVSAGYSQSNELILKFCFLVKRGAACAATAWAAALACARIRDIIGVNVLTVQPVVVEDHIRGQLEQLYTSLQQNLWQPGDIYEGLAGGRKENGLYYTPPDVVDFILYRTVGQIALISNPRARILDPACGCGAFLVRSYDLLREKFYISQSELRLLYPAEDWSATGIHNHILRHNLWGADIDSLATEVAITSLLLKSPGNSSDDVPNIVTCDSLQYRSLTPDSPYRLFWDQQYDCVIGNPPYVSFGLRGTGTLGGKYSAYLREHYPASAEYKLSYYVLFMELGIERLNEGGRLGFIVPDSFLLGRYFSKIRRYILQETTIEVITCIEKAVFPGVVTGMNVICIFQKSSDILDDKDKVKAEIYSVCDKSELVQAQPVHLMAASYFAALPHKRFRLFFDKAIEQLITKIDLSGHRLSHYASGHTGVRSLTKQTEIISTNCEGADWQRGLVAGSQIDRFFVQDEGHWLHISPAVLYKGGWNREIVSASKILVRQTGYNLTAAIDYAGFYHLNNLHSFIVHNKGLTLESLLVLLNSRLLSFYYHVTSMEFGRSMAQTDIETLEELPICCGHELDSKASELVQELQHWQRLAKQGDKEAAASFAVLEHEADQLVYQAYGLTAEEIQYVEQYEGRLQHKRRKSG